MIITKMHLSRRTFLRGSLGAMIAIPFVDAMVPALKAEAATAASRPLRFGAVYIPNGIYPDVWHPATAGADFEFKTVMKPLEGFRDQLVTVSKLKAPDGSIHLNASASFLNAVGPAGERAGELGGSAFNKIQSKKTIDQHIADRWAEDTPLRSIEVGNEDMGSAAGACDGYPCTFFNTLAWRTDKDPLPVDINPRVTFERMFGDVGSPKQHIQALKAKSSLLDSVLEETSRLKKNLGPSDNRILDEYLTNVREVEKEIARMEARQASLPNADAPLGTPESLDDHMNITYRLLHLAYVADISRVFTYLGAHEASTQSYSFIGVPEAHHSISHHGNDPEKMEKYAKIGMYHVAKLAEFLQKCKETPDGDGNLLDHMLVYFGSGMSNGNQHDRHNPPAVIVGGANGRLKGNHHVVAPTDTPTANLLLAIADTAGVELDKVGPSTACLDLRS
jgi:hypothetical protein